MSVPSIFIPKSYQEALMCWEWKQVMDDEMNAIISRQIWDLLSTSFELHVVSCYWAFTIKHHPDGTVDRYKARLVA